MNNDLKNKLSVIAKRLESCGLDLKDLSEELAKQESSGFSGEEEEIETLNEISNWLMQLKVDLDELVEAEGQ